MDNLVVCAKTLHVSTVTCGQTKLKKTKSVHYFLTLYSGNNMYGCEAYTGLQMGRKNITLML